MTIPSLMTPVTGEAPQRGPARDGDDPWTLLDAAEQKWRTGDGHGGLADVEAALRLDPSLSRALCLRGLIHHQVHRESRALADFAAAIAADPADPMPFISRANLHFDGSRYDFALADVLQAIGRAPKVADYQGFKGVILVAMGQSAQAFEAFDEAIRLDPSCAYAWWRRGELRALRGDYAGERTDKARALRLDPDVALY